MVASSSEWWRVLASGGEWWRVTASYRELASTRKCVPWCCYHHASGERPLQQRGAAVAPQCNPSRTAASQPTSRCSACSSIKGSAVAAVAAGWFGVPCESRESRGESRPTCYGQPTGGDARSMGSYAQSASRPEPLIIRPEPCHQEKQASPHRLVTQRRRLRRLRSMSRVELLPCR